MHTNDSLEEHTLSPLIGPIPVASLQLRKIGLGRFPSSSSKPRFRVAYSPHQTGAMVMREHAIDHEDDTYTLYYHFQNYGDTSCTVRIYGVEREN